MHAKLLAAVLADPDDDAARLVYSDALTDAGDPRGELIACQCEMFRLGRPQTHILDQLRWTNRPAFHTHGIRVRAGRMWHLRRRVDELLAKHAKAWTAPIGGPSRSTIRAFERGFVEGLAIDVSKFLSYADRIFALEPVRALRIRGVQARNANAFFSNRHLAAIRHLCLQPPVATEVVRALANSRQLRQLEVLDLISIKPSAETMELLAGAENLPSLKTLRFAGNNNMMSGYYRAHDDSDLVPPLKKRWGKKLDLKFPKIS